MATAVDSIEIPGEFLELAANWTGGQGDMLYAIVSSGGLKLGTLRPYDDHEGRYCTDLEWYRQLWSSLSCDINWCLRLMKPSHEDHEAMTRFAEFASDIVDKLDQEIES